VFEAQDGRGATSARSIAEEAPVMISLLPSVHALEDVVSSDKGLVRAGRAGSALLECSTLPLECKEAPGAPWSGSGS
jgi:3-hydroxyisobutyrate dehydrogenase-like beta-hydroxyacid dehydrogenase